MRQSYMVAMINTTKFLMACVNRTLAIWLKRLLFLRRKLVERDRNVDLNM